MPARMWRHGIHEFLEVGSPGPENMLAIIYIAYSVMAFGGTESLRLEMFNKCINERLLVREPQFLTSFADRKRYYLEGQYSNRPH